MSSQIATLPNLISASRIVAVIPVMWLVHAGAEQSDHFYLWAAVVLMLCCEFSDWLDGYIARRTKTVSNIGKILDPLSDSVYHAGVFMVFVASGWMPLWMLLAIIARDLGVSELRAFAQRSGFVLAARPIGKLKTAAQGAAQVLIVAMYAMGSGQLSESMAQIAWFILAAVTVLTILSLLDYLNSIREWV